MITVVFADTILILFVVEYFGLLVVVKRIIPSCIKVVLLPYGGLLTMVSLEDTTNELGGWLAASIASASELFITTRSGTLWPGGPTVFAVSGTATLTLSGGADSPGSRRPPEGSAGGGVGGACAGNLMFWAPNVDGTGVVT